MRRCNDNEAECEGGGEEDAMYLRQVDLINCIFMYQPT